ncbi:hypothetical protein BC629DRAFT_1440006 [Irpex lacteus]|nr:hypothetical protein BC629DRAFT_1440006 [Irpex lacteus]
MYPAHAPRLTTFITQHQPSSLDDQRGVLNLLTGPASNSTTLPGFQDLYLDARWLFHSGDLAVLTFRDQDNRCPARSMKKRGLSKPWRSADAGTYKPVRVTSRPARTFDELTSCVSPSSLARGRAHASSHVVKSDSASGGAPVTAGRSAEGAKASRDGRALARDFASNYYLHDNAFVSTIERPTFNFLAYTRKDGLLGGDDCRRVPTTASHRRRYLLSGSGRVMRRSYLEDARTLWTSDNLATLAHAQPATSIRMASKHVPRFRVSEPEARAGIFTTRAADNDHWACSGESSREAPALSLPTYGPDMVHIQDGSSQRTTRNKRQN